MSYMLPSEKDDLLPLPVQTSRRFSSPITRKLRQIDGSTVIVAAYVITFILAVLAIAFVEAVLSLRMEKPQTWQLPYNIET